MIPSLALRAITLRRNRVMVCNYELCIHLLDIIEKQRDLITKLVNENFEQNAIINELMREKIE